MRDLVYLFRHRSSVREAMRGERVSASFRERLMLAVTAVNECRYCSYFHSREALRAGLPRDEISALLEGQLQSAPANEQLALAYAQHWAESAGYPDPLTRDRLRQVYGSLAARDIEIVLRVISLGNLMGNTADYMLFKLSFGHFGR